MGVQRKVAALTRDMCTETCSVLGMAALGTAARRAWHGNEAGKTPKPTAAGCQGDSEDMRPCHPFGTPTSTGPCKPHWLVVFCSAAACAARPPWPACGVAVHLGRNGLRERLREKNEPADPSDDYWRASGGWWLWASGRTSTGATCAVSASKRGSSGAQTT